MGKVQLSRPAAITKEDWNYFLSFYPEEYLHELSESLKSENRFLVDERFQKLLFQYVFSNASRYQAQTTLYPGMQKLFRARIYKKTDAYERFSNSDKSALFQGYSESESFVPPKGKNVGEGRINPSNIRYLYTSSDVDTCMLEVRPQPGEYISVAEIELLDRVTLVDVTTSISTIDTDSEEKTSWINLFPFALGALFQKPYIDTGDYYLCQYICEYLKNWGLDGIKFRSSMFRSSQNGGINYTFFEPDKCRAVSSSLYYIRGMTLSTIQPTIEEK